MTHRRARFAIGLENSFGTCDFVARAEEGFKIDETRSG
jgi:hypothetical protein